MTTSRAPREQGDIGNNIKAGFGHEFDLIDLIGFLWRWRKQLLIGVLLGGLIGVSSSYIKILSQPRSGSDRVGYHWKASYELVENSTQDSPYAPPSAILSFLNTPLGATSFYGEINSRLNSPLFVVSDWVSRQENGTGFIVAMDADQGEVVIDIESTFPMSADDVGKSLRESLNRIIETFNERFGKSMASIRKENLAVNLQIGALKMSALKSFDQNKSLSSNFKKYLLEGLTKDLTQKWSVDTIVMLMGSQSSSEETISLIQSYQRQLKKLENLKSLEQPLVKQAGTEDPMIISKIGEQKKIVILDTRNTDRKMPTSFFAKPLVGIVMGAVLGLFVSLTIAVIITFYSANRERLNKIVT